MAGILDRLHKASEDRLLPVGQAKPKNLIPPARASEQTSSGNLRTSGLPIYLAPQTSNHRMLQPGFLQGAINRVTPSPIVSPDDFLGAGALGRTVNPSGQFSDKAYNPTPMVNPQIGSPSQMGLIQQKYPVDNEVWHTTHRPITPMPRALRRPSVIRDMYYDET